MYKIEVFKNKDNMRALSIDGELACFYTPRDNGELSITRADEGSENFVFLESMLDLEDFENINHFYTSHVNNLYNLVKEGEAICLA